MANVLAHLSSILIPAVIFFVIGYGWIHKCNLYDDFINGAADGLKTVVGIVPTLIGLMMAVGILRGSGLLDLPGKLLQKYAAGSSISGMPGENIFYDLHYLTIETKKTTEEIYLRDYDIRSGEVTHTFPLGSSVSYTHLTLPTILRV